MITVVYANAKILNWKQFTTKGQFKYYVTRCLCKCKDTKLKAIHNKWNEITNAITVVYANAKILNWKQFTTSNPLEILNSMLFMQMQRY